MKALQYAKTRTLPSDLLAAIFAFTRSNGVEQFRAEATDIQAAFAGIESPLIREYFVFSTDGPEPFSPALEDAVSKLQLSGLIGRINPAYDEVIIKPTTTEYLERVLRSRFTEAEVAQIEEIAKQFLASLAVQTASGSQSPSKIH